MSEDTCFDPVSVEDMQSWISNGQVWMLEGAMGRAAMRLIESGQCMLGRESHRDYWGNIVPSRYEVAKGSKGSCSFVRSLHGHRYACQMSRL